MFDACALNPKGRPTEAPEFVAKWLAEAFDFVRRHQ